jgi:hypothetical protein
MRQRRQQDRILQMLPGVVHSAASALCTASAAAWISGP